jgi:hypothetical protein
MVNSIFLLFRFCGKNARRLVTERRLHLGNPRYNYGKTSWNISRQYMEKRASVLCGAGRRRGVDRRRTYRGASPCQCELYAGDDPAGVLGRAETAEPYRAERAHAYGGLIGQRVNRLFHTR